MKKLILIMLMAALSSAAISQNLRVNEVDEFTGLTRKVTNFYEVAKNVGKLSVSAYHIGDSYGIYCFSTSDLGCSGAIGNYIIFKFTDGTTLTLDDDIADIDCGDRAISIYELNPSSIEGKTIEKIRVSMSEYYDDRTPMGQYTIQQLFDAVK